MRARELRGQKNLWAYLYFCLFLPSFSTHGFIAALALPILRYANKQEGLLPEFRQAGEQARWLWERVCAEGLLPQREILSEQARWERRGGFYPSRCGGHKNSGNGATFSEFLGRRENPPLRAEITGVFLPSQTQIRIGIDYGIDFALRR